jgi:AcrR family transcriptional regulator
VARLSVGERRELLFAAAIRVLEREGLAALSTRAIVSEAGMSLASFHYAYASHEELLVEIIASVVRGEREAGFTAVIDAGHTTPRAAIHGALSAYLDLVRSDPGREQAMFELTQHALRTPALWHLAGEQYARYRAVATELLDLLAQAFGATWDCPTEELARFVISMTDGLTLSWLADRDETASERLITLATDALMSHLEDS